MDATSRNFRCQLVKSRLLTDLDVADVPRPNVELLMKKVYLLSVLTGSEALILLSFKSGDVKSYATPKLEPLLTENQGKSLIGTLLCKDDPKPSTTGPAPAPVEDTVQWEDEDEEAAEYLANDEAREKEFKTRFTQVLNKCKFLSVTNDAENGAQILLLVATQSGKILSYTTPKLQPFTNTGPGQKLIGTLMNAKD